MPFSPLTVPNPPRVGLLTVMACLLIAVGVSHPDACRADEGDPIAVRRIGKDCIQLVSFWDLTLNVVPGEATDQNDPGAPRELSLNGSYDHVLLRQPNHEQVEWRPANDSDSEQPNVIRVTRKAAPGSDAAVLNIRVDGCCLVLGSADTIASMNDDLPACDLLVVWGEADTQWLQKLAMKIDAPQVLLVEGIPESLSPEGWDLRRISHNTMAVSHDGNTQSASKPSLSELGTEPWEMPQDLSDAFRRMEQACVQSQKVFAPLSASQMNHRPANGTHTPRWNAEHMMGRQLVFFSQIYHEIDPAIPVINRNPKQNPEDYQAAHPDWSGQEEAWQMARVMNFTQRFAYLLEGQALDRRAPGSRWPTLEALLNQMERHYQEHTANTEKKFALPDWPKQ